MDLGIAGAWIASISAGVAVCCAVLALFRFCASFDAAKDGADNGRLDGNAARTLPVMFRFLLPFTSRLTGLTGAPAMKNMRESASVRLSMAGISDSMTPEQLVGLKILFWVLAVVFFLFLAKQGYFILGLILAVMTGIYPGAWLKSTIKRRQLQIMKSLPNVLDLLTLSVESGKDFLTALRDILGRRKMDALGEELWHTFQEIQLGRKRSDALRDMSLRVRHSELTSVLNAIIQADELGVSIGQLLRIQGDMLRNKRFTLAEKIANETPVKILFPVIVFIFPAVIIILMVPILMQAFRLMS